MIEDFDPDAPSADALWARARADYAAGESASTVCERYRLTRSTFFARAKAEGWRRSDGEGAAAPDPYVAEMEAALVFELMGREATPAYVLARRAWAMAEIALLQRRRIEASSWIRIARDLRKLVMAETGALTWRRAEQIGEAAMPVRRAGAAGEVEPGGAAPGGLEAAVAEPAGLGLSSGDAMLGEEAFETAPAAVSPEPRALEAKARPAPPEPDWGQLPMSVLVSPKKLNAFLHGEFAEAWTAHLDSPDQSDRTAESGSTLSSASPAQAGGQVDADAGSAVRARPPSPTWAPACVGETE